MLELVYLGRSSIDDHAEPADAVAEPRRLVEPLRGLRVLHLSATHMAAAWRRSCARKYRFCVTSAGLKVEWRLIRGNREEYLGRRNWMRPRRNRRP